MYLLGFIKCWMFEALKDKFVNGFRRITLCKIYKFWLQIAPHPCLVVFTYKYIQKSSPVNALSSGKSVKLCCKLLVIRRLDFVSSTLDAIIGCQMKPMNDSCTTLMHSAILVLRRVFETC